jgi:flagellin-specific chaperone FliS
MLIHTANPQQAYRKVDFDARVQGADATALVRLCFEEALGSIDRALYAQASGRVQLRNEALLRAMSALAALRIGVDTAHDIGPALVTLYTDAGEVVGRSMGRFDAARLQATRDDLAEIASAIAA